MGKALPNASADSGEAQEVVWVEQRNLKAPVINGGIGGLEWKQVMCCPMVRVLKLTLKPFKTI